MAGIQGGRSYRSYSSARWRKGRGKVCKAVVSESPQVKFGRHTMILNHVVICIKSSREHDTTGDNLLQLSCHLGTLRA